MAGLRLLLGPNHSLRKVSAWTSATAPENAAHMDTMQAALEADGGVRGTLSISFASEDDVSKWILRFEHGELEVSRKAIKIKGQTLEIADQGRAVPEVLEAWGQCITMQSEDSRGCTAEALADLEVMEAMIVSAANCGEPVEIDFPVPLRF